MTPTRSPIFTLQCGMTGPEFSANHTHEMSCFGGVSAPTVRWCKVHDAQQFGSENACWFVADEDGDESGKCVLTTVALVPVEDGE